MSLTARSSSGSDLAKRVLRQADRAGLGDPLQPRGDVDAVAHQIAVALLDHVAQMNADPEFDPPVLRHAGVALDHRVLDLDRATHGVDDAAEFDQRPVAGPLDHAPVVDGDGRVDQIAAQRAEPGERAVLVRAGETAESDHVGGEDRGKFSRFGHHAPDAMLNSTRMRPSPPHAIAFDLKRRRGAARTAGLKAALARKAPGAHDACRAPIGFLALIALDVGQPQSLACLRSPVVMAGLDPAIRRRAAAKPYGLEAFRRRWSFGRSTRPIAWMAGASPAMTRSSLAGSSAPMARFSGDRQQTR